MKNISLVQVTFVVVVMAIASSLANAEDVMPKNIPEIETPESSNIEFDQLDLDKNNLISLVETEKHKLIHDAFTKIDSNSDATISKDELAEFIKQ
jgi:Ca2+-binding EF-hand superfamily protein